MWLIADATMTETGVTAGVVVLLTVVIRDGLPALLTFLKGGRDAATARETDAEKFARGSYGEMVALLTAEKKKAEDAYASAITILTEERQKSQHELEDRVESLEAQNKLQGEKLESLHDEHANCLQEQERAKLELNYTTAELGNLRSEFEQFKKSANPERR